MQNTSDRISDLSPRQREILCLVTKHFSSKEIAQHLGLSAATVDNHITSAMRRLGVRTRRDAAVLMERHSANAIFDPESSTIISEKVEIAISHHGEESLPQFPQVALSYRLPHIEDVAGESETQGEGSGRRFRWWFPKNGDDHPRKRGMGDVLFRCFWDAVYTILFFLIMSSVALGAHWVVQECGALRMDPTVMIILKLVSYILAAFDAIGVVCATGLLTFRFVRAIVEADD